MPKGRHPKAIISAAILLLIGCYGIAETGVHDDRVVFGQSAAFTGPSSALGLNMRKGIEAAFTEVNEEGGVYGRQLVLISLDDAYEPKAAIENTRSLIEQNVFALIGAVGTPTSRSAVPVAEEAGIPYLSPFTGAGFLRSQSLRNVMNVRASYVQETEAMVERLTQDLGINRVAIFYQDDSFGRAGLIGVQRSVKRRGLRIVAHGVYPRNTTAVKSALLDIEQANPGAVIIVGSYRPAATFIRWARKLDMNVQFINISFVGSLSLAQELGTDGAGVFVAQVVPFPASEDIPVVIDYRAALTKQDPDASPGFVSLEGYIAGRLAAETLNRAGPEPTRELFLETMRTSGSFDFGGFELLFGTDDNQGSDRVFLTVIGVDGKYHPVTNLALTNDP